VAVSKRAQITRYKLNKKPRALDNHGAFLLCAKHVLLAGQLMLNLSK
jgi:hypothetical protein